MSHDDQNGMSCCCSVTVSIVNLTYAGPGGRGHLLPVLPLSFSAPLSLPSILLDSSSNATPYSVAFRSGMNQESVASCSCLLLASRLLIMERF